MVWMPWHTNRSRLMLAKGSFKNRKTLLIQGLTTFANLDINPWVNVEFAISNPLDDYSHPYPPLQ